MHSYLAQKICIGTQCVVGPLPTSGPGKINNLADLVNRVVTFLIPLAAVILLFVFIWGGYDYIMSQGAPDKIKSAQAKFTTGIIGLVLLLLSYIVVRTISGIFGLGGGII
ncbi:hypothetical protein A2767_02805 [Candidatus Roizmanbacteria bacterium RIFCSPHIGHO2_01_FULL_35_10]|uniref:Uncharacterized protein n=1 Tax=Candidatus Roizmanbacteria bacterium RIFCSPLOWO2_01_FULL_35_13 TaxID=1802055 RepID=A0A1F7IF32_9BACT|nr:MAG: hypothetical protein A2767_02805 [Candidatus Roizmanbacteria bacterium RIFCSPHIGHO2_01_FULL_35_10]OGK41969.1 MAG: hypothetical protein A3A74_04705 [Candidatus Roizmanbacteria bacterium RIFCSPLOWO2_01_FULL_35_13]